MRAPFQAPTVAAVPPKLSYDEWMGPPLAELDRVGVLAQQRGGNHLPAADSPAAAEYAYESQLNIGMPIGNLYMNAALLMGAAGDMCRAVALVVGRETDPHAWAPFPLARTTLDSASMAYWLLEPGIDPESRVKRSLALDIAGAREQKRSQVSEVKASGRDLLEERRSASTRLGWPSSTKSGKPVTVGGETVPSPRSSIASVLRGRDSEEAWPDVRDTADWLWWYLSGQTHGSPQALLTIVDITGARKSKMPGMRTARLTINGGTNLSLVSAMGIATVNVLRAHSWALGADLDEVEACHKSFAVTMSVAFQQGGFSEVRYSG